MPAPLPSRVCKPEQCRPLTALLEELPLFSPNKNTAHSITDSVIAPVISLVGAGGKTTLLYALARHLADAGLKVITATTTHIFPPTLAQSPLTLLSPTLAALQEALSLHRHVTVAKEAIATGKQQGKQQGKQHGKLAGLTPEAIASLRSVANVVLVEADGAAMRPLKAPAEHEPAVPLCTELCIALCGLGGVGRPLLESVHRPERASVLCGCSPQHLVTPAHLAHITLHPLGLFRTTPTTARRTVLCMLPQDVPRAMSLHEGLHTARQTGLQTALQAGLHTARQAGLHTARQAGLVARELYPADTSVWWAGSATEDWVIRATAS